jgi:hypothetical protein
MSLSGIAALVEKFPHSRRLNTSNLLQWVRYHSAVYGALANPFKRLFKKREAERWKVSPDRVLLGAFLLRLQRLSAVQSSTRWKATEITTISRKNAFDFERRGSLTLLALAQRWIIVAGAMW